MGWDKRCKENKHDPSHDSVKQSKSAPSGAPTSPKRHRHFGRPAILITRFGRQSCQSQFCDAVALMLRLTSRHQANRREPRHQVGLIDRMSAQMKTGQFRLMGTLLMLAVLLFASATSSGWCPRCDDLNVPSSRHATVHAHDQKGSVPACDKDACSCCGFHFVAFVQVVILDLIGSSPVRELSPASLSPAATSRLYRPPRV